MSSPEAWLQMKRSAVTALHRVEISQSATAVLGVLPLLAPKDLQIGDVILHEPGRQFWYEKGIALATGSRFTHASLYVGDNMIAEARLPGVRVCDVQRPMRRERSLCILRRPGGLLAAQVVALQSFVGAALQRDARFDYLFPFSFYGSRFARLILPSPQASATNEPLPPENRGKYFCTSFVMDAFRAMGMIDRSEARAYRLGSLSAADILKDEKFGNPIGFLQTKAVLAGAGV